MMKWLTRVNCWILFFMLVLAMAAFETEDVSAASTEAMGITDEGVAFIAGFEGLYLKAYKAHPDEKGGYWTIGYGHYGADVKEGDVITKAEALVLFKKDLKTFDNYVNNFMTKNKLELTQKQFDALVSFSFNVGTKWMSSSTIRTYLVNGIENYTNEQISAAFEAWNRVGTTVLAGLTRRRRAEALMFLGGPRGTYEVTATSLNIRAGAGTGYAKKGVLYKGELISGVSINSEWTWVQFDKGWVSYEYLKFVEPTAMINKLVNTENGVSLSWSDSPGAVRYNVMRIAGTGDARRLAAVAENEYTDENVESGTTYTYYINSVSSGDVVAAENPELVGKSITYYAKPKLSALSNSEKGVTLKWNAAENAKTYWVYRKKDNESYKKLAETENLSWTDETAVSGTSYTYTAAATGKDGSIGAYDETGRTITRMAPVSELSVKNVTKGLKLSWKAEVGVKMVQISRKKKGGKWEVIKTGAKGTSYTDKTVSAGGKYKYRVRSIDSSSVEYHSTYVNAGWSYYLKKTVVTLTKVSYGVKVKWGKVKSAEKVIVYKKTGGGKWKKLATVKSQKLYKDSAVKKGVHYKYRVKAYKGSSKSVYSDQKSITL